jgi:myo-inositol-1(or 4)-monophosphatase
MIAEPSGDEYFYSIKGDKAFLNAREIQVSPVTSLEESLLATGFPYSKITDMPAYMKSIEELMGRTHGLRRLGSAALDLAYVACGRFEGYFEYGLKPWDVAAGAFLVQQAGGKVSTFRSTDDYIFGAELVAGCGIQPALTEVVHRHWYGEGG